jgi:hypothetical protein
MAVALALVATSSITAGAASAGQAQPTLAIQAADTTFGGPISATVTLAGGADPTGTITFQLWTTGPFCGTPPNFTSVVNVNGNGQYTSEPFVPVRTGSSNYWQATYSGDANNAPVTTDCFDPNAVSHVSRATPTITTSATPGADIGSTIRDSARVTSPSGESIFTGAVTFTVFGPDDPTCAGPSVFTDSHSGSVFEPAVVFRSDPFTPSAPGTYRWVASFGGNNNYEPVTAPCNAPNETSVVNDPPTRISTTATPEVTLGSPLSDTATVTAVSGPAPTGTVTFDVFGPGDPFCERAPVFTSVNRPLSGGPPTATSAPLFPPAAGRYNWVATYNGDVNYPPQTSACDAPNETSMVNKAQPTIATSATPAAVQGQPISDTVTLTGVANGPAPTGTVSIDLYGPNSPNCTAVAGPIYRDVPPLSGSPATATSAPFIATEPGTHRWVARYFGDANYTSVRGACNDPNESTVVSLAQSPIGVYRPSNGLWFIEGGPTVHWGTDGDIPVPADYSGDGPDDIAVFRPSTGAWFVHNGPTVNFGVEGDIPVPGDYDGDRDDDIAVFRPSTGRWFVLGGAVAHFGAAGDIPVPGDYNGDGDDDFAVFRPSLGVWFVQGPPSHKVVWGTEGDIPVPGDYNGDGEDEFAVFRPSSGLWLVHAYQESQRTTVAWGTSGDIPVPTDYDGDGDDEMAVFRPSLGVWFVRGGQTVVWGTNGDDPLPLPAAVRERFFP